MKYLILTIALVSSPVRACTAHWELNTIIEYIKVVNKKAPAEAIGAAIVTAADIHEVDPYLILSQMEQESGFNPLANGKKGERGLMQIKQATAKELGLAWENAYDILLNVDAGTRYLATHLKKYDNVEKALSRYNGKGPRAVQYASEVKARYMKIVWSKL